MCHQFIERFQNSKYPASLTLYSRETCCEYNTSQFLHWWKKNLFGISSKKTMKKQTLRGFDWTWQYWWRGQRRYGSAPLSLCKSDLGWIFWPRCSICWFFLFFGEKQFCLAWTTILRSFIEINITVFFVFSTSSHVFCCCSVLFGQLNLGLGFEILTFKIENLDQHFF